MPDTPGRPIAHALISVSDKTGLEPFAAVLVRHGVAILSTGGTARALRDAGIAVTDVSDHTGFPEIMDGRVKTLHPAIHGGILARRDDPGHSAALEAHGIAGIDLVVVNLYPFEEAVREGAALDQCVETIDIGGPAMIRAAAKNHEDVTVVVQPSDYAAVMEEMEAMGGATGLGLRRRLAATAFARTAAYDAAIARRLVAESDSDPLPPRFVFGGSRSRLLRYGENPHQAAALYVDPTAPPGVARAALIQGKAPSYNNLADADAAYGLVREFGPPAIAIIKHNNPCGVAVCGALAEAYEKARACDPVSAFGGVVAANRLLDGATARAIAGLFTEVVVAPDADDEARAVLAAKSDLRLLLTGEGAGASDERLIVRTLGDGFLVQTEDTARVTAEALETVTKRAPTEQERADLLFAFTVAKHVKSNAIVYSKDGATVGVGAGQMSRVDSSRIAAQKAADAAAAAGEARSRAEGCVVASDAFFPFADGLLAAAAVGATAVIQPGGSKRDDEVIAAADEQGLAMVFTGLRHFRH
ncbi:MAG: bifunctional phosphoribosylaminoimidazolecarboxamide formyltransferase/IMP cyclohydrolase [Rhodospirillales bacterium]|nr:bifunctional phosphoribosylaminoimidazolecarboxamide formyltransferase/IMP cyclohydrolase [Rhodospirillales bacterium]